LQTAEVNRTQHAKFTLNCYSAGLRPNTALINLDPQTNVNVQIDLHLKAFGKLKYNSFIDNIKMSMNYFNKTIIKSYDYFN